MVFGNRHLIMLFPPEQSKDCLHFTLHNSQPATGYGHDEDEDHDNFEFTMSIVRRI